MAFVFALLLVGTTPAWADDSAEDRAHALFLAGRVAAKSGDDARACTDFAASLELRAAPGTLINLALCEEHLHRYARSYEHFQAFLSAVDPNDDRRELASSHTAELTARLARLSLRVAPGFSDVFVTLDEAPVKLDGSAPIVVDPGRHRVTFRAGALLPQTAQLELAAGVETTLEVPWVVTEPSRPPSTTRQTRAPASVTHAALVRRPARMPVDSGRNLAGWVMAGVGVAALAASAGLGIGILEEKRIVELHCPEGRCDREGWGAAKSGRTLVIAGTAALAIGAIAGGSGAYLLLAPSWSVGRRAAFFGVGARF